MMLLEAPMTPNLPEAQGGSDAQIELNENTIVARSGPRGTQADLKKIDEFEQITTYIVREGDTIGHIAELYNISTNTIRWQNDLDHKAVIFPGQHLIILPVDGIEHIVEKGDTLASITEKYKGYIDEVEQFNNISRGTKLTVGTKIIVPGGEPLEQVRSTPIIASKTTSTGSSGSGISSGYYVRPIPAGKGRKSQSYHGRWRAVDVAVEVGTPVLASAPGKVIVVNNYGWGGGYGNYIVIAHDNGSKTLYAHNSRNIVSLGQYVNRGETIGYSGNTGRSTGPHLHFEIRGGIDVPCVQFGFTACY